MLIELFYQTFNLLYSGDSRRPRCNQTFTALPGKIETIFSWRAVKFKGMHEVTHDAIEKL